MRNLIRSSQRQKGREKTTTTSGHTAATQPIDQCHERITPRADREEKSPEPTDIHRFPHPSSRSAFPQAPDGRSETRSRDTPMATSTSSIILHPSATLDAQPLTLSSREAAVYTRSYIPANMTTPIQAPDASCLSFGLSDITCSPPQLSTDFLGGKPDQQGLPSI